jgi:hypothetical protein
MSDRYWIVDKGETDKKCPHCSHNLFCAIHPTAQVFECFNCRYRLIEPTTWGVWFGGDHHGYYLQDKAGKIREFPTAAVAIEELKNAVKISPYGRMVTARARCFATLEFDASYVHNPQFLSEANSE